MSGTSFNLLPWRERQREQSLRRWRWGLALSLLFSLVAVHMLDQWLTRQWQQQTEQGQAWQAQQQSLQAVSYTHLTLPTNREV